MNKKQYMMPEVRIMVMRPAQMLAVSIQEGPANPEEPILVKEEENEPFFFGWGESLFGE